MNIDEEFDSFIEFPSEAKNYVTTVSAKLFAQHCIDAERKKLTDLLLKDITGSITIVRPTCGNGDKYISIQVKDESSRIRFLEVKIDLEQFAECITGRSETPVTMTVKGAEHIGKIKESKPMSFPVSARDIILAAEKAEDLCPKGWLVSRYFGSKDSFCYDEIKGYTANTTIYRYVDRTD